MPKYIAQTISQHEGSLSEEEINNPAYQMKIYFTSTTSRSIHNADEIVQTSKSNGRRQNTDETIFFKDTEKPRCTRRNIINLVREAGFPRFNSHQHNELVLSLDAKDREKFWINGRL